MNNRDNGDLLRDHHPDVIRLRLQQAPKSHYISDAVLGGIDGYLALFCLFIFVWTMAVKNKMPAYSNPYR